jgi:metal-responsive CopG/Arc/MetJ family transcriptional regulator
MSIDETNKPKRGRPTAETSAVNLRLPDDVLQAIDDARRKQSDLPNRPEMIRRIIVDWLKMNS